MMEQNFTLWKGGTHKQLVANMNTKPKSMKHISFLLNLNNLFIHLYAFFLTHKGDHNLRLSLSNISQTLIFTQTKLDLLNSTTLRKEEPSTQHI